MPTSPRAPSPLAPHAAGVGGWRDPMVLADLAGTGVFTVTAVAAAVLFTTPLRWVGAIVALVLFAAGVVAFLWGYWTSVQRSRTEEIAVSQLYFLTGDATPRGAAARLNGLLIVQVTVALATALARPSTNGEPGSSLAFGILVPMFGLGINGLWASRHGTFGPRRRRRTPRAGADPDASAGTGDAAPGAAGEPHGEMGGVPRGGPRMEQNAPHG